MSASHLIDNAVIDIAYGRGVGDSAHRSEVETFVTTSLLAVMEDLFDEQLADNEVLRISQLDLDLGEIIFSDYREQMPARLREELLKALDEIKRRQSQSGDHRQAMLSGEESDRELLHYFLRHGSLPWYRAKCDMAELERILVQQLSDNPAGLQRFLRQTGGNMGIYSRLVLQFGEKLRLQLIEAFAPTVADRLSHNMNLLHNILARLRVRDANERQGHTLFYHRVWAALLKAVVDGSASAISADELFERLLKKELAASPERVVNSIRAGSPAQPSGTAGDSPLSRLILRLVSGQAEPFANIPHSGSEAPWLAQGVAARGDDAESHQLHRQLEAFLLGAEVDYKLWCKLFKQHPEILTEALRHYGKREAVRRHLVVQLDDPQLLQLLTLLEPTEHGFIHAVIDESTSRKAHDEVASVEPPSRGEAWEFTLAYLFVERGSRFNKQSYLTSLVKQMANHRNLYLAEVLLQITAGVNRLDMGSRFSAQILQTLRDIAQQFGITQSGASNTLTTQNEEPGAPLQDATTRQLQQQWIEFLRGGKLSTLPWQSLYEEQGEMVIVVLRRYAQQRAARKHLIQQFSTEMLHQVVALLQPSEQEFICNTVAQTVRNQHRTNIGWTEEAVSEAVWEFTLAYLVVEQESRFNRRSYLTHLLRQMASARNMSAAQLLEYMRHSVEEDGVNSRFALQLTTLLGEIAEALNIDTHSSATRTRLSDAYTHYQLLADLLRGRRASSLSAEQAQLHAVEQLQRHTPWLLSRLFAELQQDASAYREFVANANLALLRQLLESYLQLSNSPQHQTDSDFHRAISQHAATVQDPRLFYSYVFDALLNDELIDFELFPGGTTTLPQRDHTVSAEIAVSYPEEESPAYSECAEEKRDDTPDEGQVVQEIGRLLNTKRSLVDSEARQLAEHFEYLLEHYPAQVRRQLLIAIKERATLEQFMRHLPESLLGKLLPFINTAAQRLLASAELLTTAAYSNNLGLKRSQLQRIKWQAVYTYVAHIGSLFNPQEYVRVYLGEFTDHLGQNAQQQLGRGLAEQLKQSARPSTQSAVYPLLKGLSAVIPAIAGDRAPPAATERGEVEVTLQTEGDEIDLQEEIHIENAGLVLATPYLPMLFDRLGLTDDRKFKDRESAEMGIHMLQYLVTAKLESAEFKLVLNKLLCGVEPGLPIRRSITLSETQGEQLDGLLTAMIQHWSALGNTSIAGLRETFLNRPGVLRLQDDAWRLKVEERAFDVLLDRIPWSYSTIKYPWMKQVIYVEWR